MPLSVTAAFILHLGALDGSAGVAVSNDLFIGASDEVNVLQRHSTLDKQLATEVLNLDNHQDWLGGTQGKEADIEGATRVGDVVYWIGSHAMSSPKIKKDGTIKPAEPKPERHVLFATRLTGTGVEAKMKPTGKVYHELVKKMDAALPTLKLGEAAGLPPKTADGLNIESLCAAPDGKTFFIGFRGPIREGKALLVPLLNGPDLVADGAATPEPKFGEPILLDLGGRGLRDMVWWRGAYLLIGGYFDEHLTNKDAPKPKLFRWSGKASDKVTMLNLNLDDLNPEGLVVFPDDRVLITSDDGAWTPPGASANQKETLDAETKSITELGFRSVWLEGKE